ncbi:MAG TPA: DnaJ domain-containing protein, partial [Blastocatellia bacterium]|nr:DnaJ domain-containing protein [Blastocatellia bacterium]
AASGDEIRSAYRKRISVIHPDRFDPIRQPEQWQAANEMLMELNSAYDVLHHPAKRARYDERLADRRPKSAAGSAVHCRFDELPDAARQRLLVMQNGKSRFFKLQSHSPANVFKFKTGNPAAAWCGLLVALLLLGAGVWFEAAGGGLARRSLLMWACALPCVAALLAAGHSLVRWYRSPVKDYVYLTPLYYIKTSPGRVTFRWLWSSETLMVKPLVNRLRQSGGGLLLLAFDDEPQRLKLATEAAAREMAYALSVWEKLIVDLDGKRDGGLLDQLDAFPEISVRLGKRPAPDLSASTAAKKKPVDDGAARRGAVEMEPNWLYVKGW